ncbi:DUF6134 family protein [Roseospira navarrensis]|uniref:DUF3108 domain-containing protein n=1 Tax=Roseospira navarrensis TaxID=140058 RepID=A0A7X2D2Y7_9PROT|nr:DUF6134 family protein [Roseospira navarrensis]MQX36759.1 hypothetical protein [Roseospira navarrensis]
MTQTGSGRGHSRRAVLAGGLTALVAGSALVAGGVPSRAARAQTIPDGYALNQTLTYRIFRGDDPIGKTVFEFYARGADRTIVTRTNINVSVLIYSYASQHMATEVWENGQLVRLETRTNDDGEPFRVDGAPGTGGFTVTGSEGTVTVSPTTPPKSFWNAGILTAPKVITTKRGAVAPVKTRTIGRERVAYKGGSTDAVRYRFETDDVIDLWYTDDGLWVKALRESFGEDIVYLLDTTGG